MGTQVELNDVQGMIIKGYGNMPFAVYILLQFTDEAKTKEWLKNMTSQITNGETSSKTIDSAINVAFTRDGIASFGLNETSMRSFSREFDEGMVTDHRKRILGDYGQNDPAHWYWGGESKDTIHANLIVFAKTEEMFKQVVATQEQLLQEANIVIQQKLDTTMLYENKEHFGFRDGIANPVMKDAKRNEGKEHKANLINPGEFIFGYKNEYDKYPLSPSVPEALDIKGVLQPYPNSSGQKDLGRNGSMMVFRQMEQDVVGFWKFLEKANQEQKAENTSSTIEHLGAKMVGRWPNGSPLTKCPMEPNDKYKTFDNFGYAEKDFDGMKCPIGAHVRRTNPRDNFLRNSTGDLEKDIEKSQKFTKRFRVLRRGRSYGQPISPTLDPQEILQSTETKKERGLHFICFNTSIGRQFELIQQTWVNNPKFAGLYDDPDPIIGNPQIMGENATTTFTEPAQPIRKKIKGVPQFVEVKGGAYFFMPGIKALEFLSSI